MSSEPLYRLLEAWEDCPEAWMSLAEALSKVLPDSGVVQLKEDSNGLYHIEGTAFYLQPMTVCPERAAA